MANLFTYNESFFYVSQCLAQTKYARAQCRSKYSPAKTESGLQIEGQGRTVMLFHSCPTAVFQNGCSKKQAQGHHLDKKG